MAPATLCADTLRVASFHTELHRSGPGLLLRDILKDDPQTQAVATLIAASSADILVLQSFDYDAGFHALKALRDKVQQQGASYPHLYMPRPNTGRPSGMDIDGDGRLAEPEDAIGYGAFIGNRAIAVLSRFPIHQGNIHSFSNYTKDAPLPISSVAHEVIPIDVNGSVLSLLVHHATPPVFDGPEDRNGKRNAKENLLWRDYLDGALPIAPQTPLLIASVMNVDPETGEGDRTAVRQLLNHTRLQSPPQHQGRPTAIWPAPDPGPMRVSYLLPSSDLTLVDAGILDSQSAPNLQSVIETASRHRLIWVDLSFSGRIPDPTRQ